MLFPKPFFLFLEIHKILKKEPSDKNIKHFILAVSLLFLNISGLIVAYLIILPIIDIYFLTSKDLATVFTGIFMAIINWIFVVLYIIAKILLGREFPVMYYFIVLSFLTIPLALIIFFYFWKTNGRITFSNYFLGDSENYEYET